VKKTSYISLDIVIAIHDDMVEKYGGNSGIRDLVLIQSAIARPQSSFQGEELYANIFDKAAALFHSIIFNHAFIDGNKRTAMVSTARFLSINEYTFDVNDKEFVNFPLQVESNHLSIEKISEWLKTHSRKINTAKSID
jgi:death-on-curing protein